MTTLAGIVRTSASFWELLDTDSITGPDLIVFPDIWAPCAKTPVAPDTLLRISYKID